MALRFMEIGNLNSENSLPKENEISGRLLLRCLMLGHMMKTRAHSVFPLKSQKEMHTFLYMVTFFFFQVDRLPNCK